MLETKYRRMQRLPFERDRSALGASIDWVSSERMPDIFHMYADLMRPAGFQLQLKQGVIAEPFKHSKMRYRMFASTFNNGKQLTVIRITADRRVYCAVFMRDIAMYKGDVFASNRVFLQLGGK